MGVSEGAEYSMGMRVAVTMVVVFVVVIGRLVMSGGTVVVVGMISFVLVYKVVFLVVCRLGGMKHTCSHRNGGERSGCVCVTTDPSPSYPNREAVVDCG